MRLFTRTRIALLLTVIYTLIIVTPLAPLLMRSATIAHAVTGECAGDCTVCGCAPEVSASRACCCWQKKRLASHEHENKKDCCEKAARKNQPVLSCGCPCGDDKPLALFAATDFELLPYHFSEGIPAAPGEHFSSLHPNRLADRHGDPPDPPPKLATLA